MNIIHLCLTPLAGAPIRIASALNKFTDNNVRLINLNPTCYGKRTFPEDLIWEKDKEECLDLISSADILHFHHFINLENENNPFKVNFKKLAPTAKFIRQFHSDLNFIANTDENKKFILEDKYPKLVIPHCAERSFLDVFVVPNIIPIDELKPIYIYISTSVPKVFFSASTTGSMWCTRWNTKGYPEIVKKFNELKKKNNFDFITVTDTPYEECQRIKQNSDIVVGDITSGSYHLTDLEALSMGKPTFSYLDSRTQLTLTALLGCTDLPFINTRIEEIDLPFTEIINDRSLLKEVGEFSRYWIEKYYNEKVLVKIYEQAYEKVMNNEPLHRQDYLTFNNAKMFLYNRLYDLQWMARMKSAGVDENAINMAEGQQIKRKPIKVFPKFLVRFFSCFIINQAKRRNFRNKYIKKF